MRATLVDRVESERSFKLRLRVTLNHSSHVPEAGLNNRDASLLSLLGREHIPEPKCFVSCACDQSLTVRTRCKVQDPVRVASEGCHALHTGVLPDVDGVLAVSMGGNKLIDVFGKHQIANLTASLD